MHQIVAMGCCFPVLDTAQNWVMVILADTALAVADTGLCSVDAGNKEEVVDSGFVAVGNRTVADNEVAGGYMCGWILLGS